MIFLILLFLCWGSFLNVLAYRLIRNQDIVWLRSACPHCNQTLAWSDLIPVLSWIYLRGACRYCHKSISVLYPAIELVTTGLLTALYCTIPHHFFLPYFIFFSALLVTIRSDLETMLISRFVTIFLIPIPIVCAFFGFLPITCTESIIGAVLGYCCLFVTARIFFWITKKQGVGQGDLELLAFIGAFTGIFGCWITLTLGSILGSVIGLIYLLIMQADRSVKIPFGPFLAAGASIYVLFQEPILHIFIYF